MSDYINRQEIVDYIKQNGFVYATTLETWPAADVRDDTHGEWKSYHESDFGWDEYGIQCSVCGVRYDSDDVKFKLNFCPNCGADMRGSDQ